MAVTPNAGRRALRAANRRVTAALPLPLRRRWLYLYSQRRVPHFTRPRTFSEKVNWRILHDRRESLEWTCDKLAMKEHARASGADIFVPGTLWHGTDVRALADVALPSRWVLKPNHRYGLVHFGDADTDLEALARETTGWLADAQTDYYGEWAYSRATKQLLVEEFLGDGSTSLDDYKVFVFDGVPALVQVDLDRFGGHRRALYTPEWRQIGTKLGVPEADPMPPPSQLRQLLAAASTLGSGFDFMRIDLYLDGERVVFGEYTPYPASGLSRFSPYGLEHELSRHWRLPELDPSGR